MENQGTQNPQNGNPQFQQPFGQPFGQQQLPNATATLVPVYKVTHVVPS